MGLEAALLGTGAVGAMGPMIPTAGLIGSGGALSFAGLGSALSVASGLSSIMGGMDAKSEGKRQAEMALYTAGKQGAEATRQAQAEANLVRSEAESTRRRQKVAFLKSGVSLEGSPLQLMEATRQRGLQNVEEIFRAGGAATGAAATEGRLRAQNYKAAGRQQFMSGLTSAGTSFARLF